VERANDDPTGVHGFAKKRIWDLISFSPKRLTPADLERSLRTRSRVESRVIRRAVRELVAQGRIQYSYRLGCSFLEQSIQGVLRISEHLVLKPPQISYSPGPYEVVVALAPGSAFGLGDHASTRLALKGIEMAIRVNPGLQGRQGAHMLDIGTGSGVLMIAAVLLGLEGAIGIETDSSSRYEARENVKINSVEDRVEVTDKPVAAQTGPFALVAANLRFPTLKSLAVRMQSLTDLGGGVVVSGIREWELEDLVNSYHCASFSTIWRGCDQGWWGALFANRTGAK